MCISFIPPPHARRRKHQRIMTVIKPRSVYFSSLPHVPPYQYFFRRMLRQWGPVRYFIFRVRIYQDFLSPPFILVYYGSWRSPVYKAFFCLFQNGAFPQARFSLPQLFPPSVNPDFSICARLKFVFSSASIRRSTSPDP